jgi:hypothetical protein
LYDYHTFATDGGGETPVFEADYARPHRGAWFVRQSAAALPQTREQLVGRAGDEGKHCGAGFDVRSSARIDE